MMALVHKRVKIFKNLYLLLKYSDAYHLYSFDVYKTLYFLYGI